MSVKEQYFGKRPDCWEQQKVGRKFRIHLHFRKWLLPKLSWANLCKCWERLKMKVLSTSHVSAKAWGFHQWRTKVWLV